MRLTVTGCFIVISVFSGCQKNDIDPAKDMYWEVADPAELGMNTDSLDHAVALAAGMDNFHALLVARDNKLAVEAYFRGKDARTFYHLRSATKNIVSALAGVALEEGILDSIDASIQPDFPDVIDEAKAAITLDHLLNMSSGLTWDEDGEVLMLIQHNIPDPVNTLLSRPLSSAPGTAFNYNSVSTHIVAHIISNRAGMPLEQYAESRLFDRIGIADYRWERDPEGQVWGGFGLQLTARDLAKFGQLYLDDGHWEGSPVVPSDWTDRSSTVQMDVPGSGSDYSLQWWISESTGTPIMFGLGFGGQVLMVIPSKRMIIVALQEHLVSFDQSNIQWLNFANQVFGPVFRSVD